MQGLARLRSTLVRSLVSYYLGRVVRGYFSDTREVSFDVELDSGGVAAGARSYVPTLST